VAFHAFARHPTRNASCRVPYGEASRKAGCGSSAFPFGERGRETGLFIAFAPILDSTIDLLKGLMRHNKEPWLSKAAGLATDWFQKHLGEGLSTGT